MEIKIISPEEKSWIKFISSNPSGTLFHHPAWIQLISEFYNYQPFVLTIVDSYCQILAGVPFIEINKPFVGKKLVSLPFTDHCAPLYKLDCQDLIKDAIYSLYLDSGAKELELRWDFPLLPSLRKDLTQVLHWLNLESSPESLFSNFQPAHRRNIKTAQKSGLQVEWGIGENELWQFYQLHLETRRRQGMPAQPWRFFQLLGKQLLESGFGFVLLAYKKGKCIAASIFLHWNDSLIYKWGASTKGGLQYRPNNLILWEAIQWGYQNGCTRFDFGRTNIENAGLRRFKSGFGAQEMPLVYSILSRRSVSSISANNLKILRFVIHHSPKWICRAAGEVLYRCTS